MKSLDAENVMPLLDSIYEQVVNGIPKISKPVDQLALDYVTKHPNKEVAIKKMLRNQVTKCTVTGVMTGLGGAITLPVAVSADVASVLYVQLRMIAATAYMCNYDLKSDQAKTFIYACLAGVSIDKVLADAGLKFGEKFAVNLIKKIPGDVLTKINQKVGFRLITKFGEKGVVNLGKLVPAVGAIVGGGFNLAETRIIAHRAYKVFYEEDIFAFDDDVDVLDAVEESLDDDVELI